MPPRACNIDLFFVRVTVLPKISPPLFFTCTNVSLSLFRIVLSLFIFTSTVELLPSIDPCVYMRMCVFALTFFFLSLVFLA